MSIHYNNYNGLKLGKRHEQVWGFFFKYKSISIDTTNWISLISLWWNVHWPGICDYIIMGWSCVTWETQKTPKKVQASVVFFSISLLSLHTNYRDRVHLHSPYYAFRVMYLHKIQHYWQCYSNGTCCRCPCLDIVLVPLPTLWTNYIPCFIYKTLAVPFGVGRANICFYGTAMV